MIAFDPTILASVGALLVMLPALSSWTTPPMPDLETPTEHVADPSPFSVSVNVEQAAPPPVAPAPPPVAPVPATDLIGELTQATALLAQMTAAYDVASARVAAMLKISGAVFHLDSTANPPEVTVYSPVAEAPGFVVTRPKHESTVNWTPGA